MKEAAENVYGALLRPCSSRPLTGFFRDGCCNTSAQDAGCHTVCAEMTEAFLEFSRARGNDLTTPMPAYGFPGLKPGDRWCLCASRWKEALDAGVAPRVFLRSTHKKTLQHVSLSVLEEHAADSGEGDPS